MKVDILVIGGGAAGMTAAMASRAYYPDRQVLLVRQTKQAIVPCAIPYIFASLDGPQDIVVPDSNFEKAGVNIMVDTVTELDVEKHTAATSSGETIEWQRLVLATGSGPVDLPIPGTELEGVWVIKKDVAYLESLRQAVLNAKSVAIIGCGFIGAELADELLKIDGLQVHVIEMLPQPLALAFDSEVCEIVEKILRDRGANLHMGRMVKQIYGDGKAEGVELDDGTQIPADAIIVSVGARANSELAEQAGLRCEEGVWVDEYTRTSAEGVFAVGDCAIKRDFFTRRRARVMLASTASAEARTAVANLFGLRVVKVVKGTLAAFSTFIGGMAFGIVGMTEHRAREEGFRVVVGRASAPNRHPGKLPGTATQHIKLVFGGDTGVLLGGQVWGAAELGETLTAINLAVQKQMTVGELEALQYATHPWLTASPVGYPLVIAAQDALRQM